MQKQKLEKHRPVPQPNLCRPRIPLSSYQNLQREWYSFVTDLLIIWRQCCSLTKTQPSPFRCQMLIWISKGCRVSSSSRVPGDCNTECTGSCCGPHLTQHWGSVHSVVLNVLYVCGIFQCTLLKTTILPKGTTFYVEHGAPVQSG